MHYVETMPAQSGDQVGDVANQFLKNIKSAEVTLVSGEQSAVKRSTGAKPPRGIDSKVSVNKGICGLAEQLAQRLATVSRSIRLNS